MNYMRMTFLVLIIFTSLLFSQIPDDKKEFFLHAEVCLRSIPKTIPMNQIGVRMYGVENSWYADIYDDEKPIYKLAASHVRMPKYLPQRASIFKDLKVNLYELDSKGKGIAIDLAYCSQIIRDSCLIFYFPLSSKMLSKLSKGKEPVVIFYSYVLYNDTVYEDLTKSVEIGNWVYDNFNYDNPSYNDIVKARLRIVYRKESFIR